MRWTLLILVALLTPAMPVDADHPDVVFETATARHGDAYLYHVRVSEVVTKNDTLVRDPESQPRVYDPGEWDVLVEVGENTTTIDAYGREVPAVEARYTRFAGDDVREALTCYLWPTTGTGPRTDYHVGGSALRAMSATPPELAPVLSERHYANTSYVTLYQGDSCDVVDNALTINADASRYFGALFMAPRNFPGTYAAAQPALVVPTTFHGAPAMEFTYVLTSANAGTRSGPEGEAVEEIEGTLVATVAQGYAGYVKLRIEETRRWFDEERVSLGELELVGHTPGDAPLAPADRSLLPDWRARSPLAFYEPLDARRVPDAALELPYRYQEAMDALLSDPSIGLKRWLDARPDAALTQAQYDRRIERSGFSFGVPSVWASDGGWYVSFTDGFTEYSVMTARYTAATTPAGALELPRKHVVNQDFGERATETMRANRTLSVISQGDTLRLLAQAGIEPDTIQSVYYWAGSFPEGDLAQLQVSQLPAWSPPEGGDASGLLADIDLAHGRLDRVTTTSKSVRSDGLLPATAPRTVPERDDHRAAGALALLAGPLPGLGVAGAAATGVALVWIIVKFLFVPFFTRLARDRLLENPVRARLYERIRMDPGAHLNEMEDYAGIGRGATRHHLDKLVRHGLVFAVDEGGYTRLYASGEVPPTVARRTAILRAGSHARVYELFAARPNATLREAATELGMSAPSVHRAKKRLEKAGLLPAAPEVATTTSRS